MDSLTISPLLEVSDLKIHFPIFEGIIRRQVGSVKAVDGVSFTVRRGETLGLVGESGCGKTTTGWGILQLHKPTSGEVLFDGQNLTAARAAQIKKARRRLQMIFQDPSASLNPRMTVGATIGEPMRVHKLYHGAEQRERVGELMEKVGLNPALTGRYPHQFSGGQQQRIGIARALAVQPDFIVCDEPISALDVSIQAQIINLLQDLQEEFNLTYLFIAHDLSVVKHISNRVAVMYLGKIVELSERLELYEKPLHPYTEALLSAVPIPDPRLERMHTPIVLEGELPSPANPPSGCRFHTRCPRAMLRCTKEEPKLVDQGGGHFAACFLHSDEAA